MIQHGVGSITIDGNAIARLNNISVNITYDTALLRGGRLIFPDFCALYNGNIEGTFENGEITLSAVGDMMGITSQANSAITLSALDYLNSGLDMVISCTTNGITAVVTLYNCKFPSQSLTFDRENYTMPTTNFVVAGETEGTGTGRIMKIDTT